MKTEYFVAAFVALAVTIGTGWLVGGNQSALVGGVTNYDSMGLSALKVGTGCNSSFGYAGCAGTEVTKLLNGTCNASQSTAASHAATTSKEFICAVADVTAGDRVFVSLPAGAGDYSSGSESLAGGFILNAAYATTSGYIGFSIYNGTGAATSSYAQATTSVQYLVLD